MDEGAAEFLEAFIPQHINNRVFLPYFTITPSQIHNSNGNPKEKSVQQTSDLIFGA